MAHNRKARATIHRALTLALVGMIVGSLSAIATIGFTELIVTLNHWLLPARDGAAPLLNPDWQVILVLTGGGLVVGLLLRFSDPPGVSLGPQDTIYAVQLHQPLPSPRSGALSTLAAAVSLGCGASVGLYGPVVYLGSLVGQLIPSLALHLRDLKNIAIACGVAAAIATAFNAPIAALIFAHEVILRHYSLRAFTAVTVASATGYVVSHLIFEHQSLFLIEAIYQLQTTEYPLFAIEGLACGFLAVMFLKLLGLSTRISATLPMPRFCKPAIAGLLMSLVVIAVPEVLGAGNDIFFLASVDGHFSAADLLLILIAKIAVTVLCLGFGFAGGVIFPALLVGTLFGALFAITVPANLISEYAGLSAYAIAGMMALMSPIIGAPMTALLLVFELTHNYEITIAAMVSIVFANLVSYQWYGRSLYDNQLLKRGMDLSLGREQAYLMHRGIIDSVEHYLPSEPQTATVEQARERMQNAQRDVIVVTDDQSRYLGLVYAYQLTGLDGETTLQELEHGEALEMSEKTSLWQAMGAIRDKSSRIIVVLDSSSHHYRGSVTPASIISSYLDATGELRREEYEI